LYDLFEQIQVEAEQWTQVQDVLKHVCTEMATLQQARQGWEKRALNAESQAAAWQLKVICSVICSCSCCFKFSNSQQYNEKFFFTPEEGHQLRSIAFGLLL
jgi:hypothetical protein